MSAQAVTILSGLVLLLIFGLVGWNLRRRKGPQDEEQASRGKSS